MKRALPALALSFLLALFSCGDPAVPEVKPVIPVLPPPPAPEPQEPEPGTEDPKTLEINISDPYTDLSPGESMTLHCTLSGTEFDQAKSYNLLFNSSNPSVATVDGSGKVVAIARGSTVVRISEQESGAWTERKFYVVDLSPVKQAYSSGFKFTCGHTLYYKAVVQSWDFFDDYLYACQVCGSPHTLTFTRKPVHSQAPQAYMHLKYYGHGDNMFVERSSEGDWLWTPNYGTLESGSTNRYTDSQVLSRVKFTPGLTVQPSFSAHNYVLPGMKRIIAACDSDNGSLGIWCRDASGKAWFYVYDIEAVKSASAENIQLAYNVSYGSPVVTEKPIVKAVNLAKLTPLLKFQMPFNYVPQGYDWHHGKLWFFRGGGAEADQVEAGTAKNWATVYLINQQGKTIETAAVPWVDNLALLASEGLTDLGYFEAEGVKIKDGMLYLGFASKDAGASPERRVNIFKYPLD